VDYTVLGDTGLRVSVMGLGCGGPSRLGQRHGVSDEESARVVRRALDLGVNIIDTAEAYRTEEIVGKALDGIPRDAVVISTKKSSGADVSPEDVVAGLEASLQRLRTDRVEVYHMHGVSVADYPHVRENLVPALLRLRDEGKIRCLGVTEAFESDSEHRMLRMALRDDCWQVMMVGHNILNQSARERVFSITREKGIGTLVMFAVRRAFSRPDRLREILADLADRGKVAPELAEEPLRFLVDDYGAADPAEAAYRFCRHEPGVDVVLSGTGNPEHVAANAASLCRPDLPAEARERLARLFALVDDVSGS